MTDRAQRPKEQHESRWKSRWRSRGLATYVSRPRRGRAAGCVALSAATLWACLLSAAMALHYQRDSVWGVPEEVRQNYQRLRHRVDVFFDASPP